MLVAVGLTALPLAFAPSGVSAQELRDRLFVARVGVPGVAIEVSSLRGADVFVATTDDDGRLIFELRVADSDEVRFVSASDRWQLEWAKPVRNAHRDPDIPLELDIGAFLQRVESRRASPEKSPGELPEHSKPGTVEDSAAGENTADALESLRCEGAGDFQCLLRLKHRLSEARERGDCRAALELAQRLLDDLPDFAASDPAAVELASLHFDCAQIERIDGDPYERSELLLRRAIALAAGADGTGWCHPQRSRLLAAAHAQLRETATAAASAHRAGELCPSNPVPVEWEFYFRLGLGQVDRAAEVAERAEGELGAFLADWSIYAAGECPVTLDWRPPPCVVLPDGACARARTGWILRCGDDEQLSAYADVLRSGLDSEGSGSPSESGAAWKLENLAEVEMARGEWDTAADLFGRLLAGSLGASAGRLGSWACRRGDALLRARRPAGALEAFESASKSWEGTRLTASALDRLVVENNALVLAAEVRGTVDESRFRAVKERLDALPKGEPGDGSGSESLRSWRLAVENNLLELRTRAEADQAEVDPIEARAALERLRALEAEYRRHVQSLFEVGGEADREAANRAGNGADVPRACSRLAFASEPGLEDATAIQGEAKDEAKDRVEDEVTSEQK